MNAKLLFVIALLVASALLTSEYLGFTHFLNEEGGAAEKQSALDSFNVLTTALSKNDGKTAAGMVAPSFKDKIDRKKFIKILTQKRKLYQVSGVTVKTRGEFATFNYTRKEARAGGQPFNFAVKGEMWVQDKKNKKVWKLHKLGQNDKWFRSLKGPEGKKKKKKVKKEEPDLLKEARLMAGPREMKEGDQYTSRDKRDPFRSLISGDEDESDTELDKCDPGRPRQFLEKFDLMSLKLSGVIMGTSGPMALITTPDGKGHTVRSDMYLGRNCGRVIDITQDTMLILEKAPKPGAKRGEFMEITTPLKLRPAEEG